MTKRVIGKILEKLSEVSSYTSVGEEFSVSASTVQRIFENVQYSKPQELPEVLGIDEFKGNSGGEKFHGILTDIGEKRVIDILKTRKSSELFTYFKEYPNMQKSAFADWIQEAEESDIKSFQKCAKTYHTWFTPIVNSFFCPYTNGFTEGCNNKIKVIKRNAFGLHNFKRFRNRILFTFQSNMP